jgi:sulfide:quinone oxidoreductase
VSNKTILILGGGVGGIMAAASLRRLCAPEHRIVVIERRATFSLRMANLWLMTGERQRPEEGERNLSRLTERGIEWVQGEVEKIDPVSRTVQTSVGTLAGDYLVIALGAERHPQAVPGFAEAALDLYEAAGALRIRQALERFNGGRVVILVARTPFSCPSAPYEAACLIDSLLRRRGVRQRSEIAVYTPEDLPMPVAGPEVGAALVQLLGDRGIEFHAEQVVMKVDPTARVARFELEDAKFDLLIGVPPHRVPQVLSAAKLVDASGWVPVDPGTLRTRHLGVYAIGDATSIRLPVGMFLPKAGVFADEEARVVAENIAAEVGGKAGTSRFNGHGFCYIEVGDDKAAYGAGNFYGIPTPTITLEPPSPRYRKEKHELERTAQALWL